MEGNGSKSEIYIQSGEDRVTHSAERVSEKAAWRRDTDGCESTLQFSRHIHIHRLICS